MLGKVASRSSSQYLYLWRQCVQSHRPGLMYAPRGIYAASLHEHETNHRHLTYSTAQHLQEEVAKDAPVSADHLIQDASKLAWESGKGSGDDNGQRRLKSKQRRQLQDIPTLCPGCGAHSQTVESTSPGYYDITKLRNTSANGGHQRTSDTRQQEDEVYQSMLRRIPDLHPTGQQPTITTPPAITPMSSNVPICDRCHELRYHSRGHSIIHPSMTSIQAIIQESPHKHNHIYHVLDAADFPLSLIPNLQHALNLPRLRTQNRRSKTLKYIRGRVAEVSFIVTRSDLLAPKKEQVDSMMPYLQEVLRDALGRSSRNVRLGNVRCVSAKRGWWTKNVKEEIYARGGAGWMVGKVNVGKSALFEVVYPKGRGQEDVNIARLRHQAMKKDDAALTDFPAEVGEVDATRSEEAAPPIQESELAFNNEAKDDLLDDDGPLDEDEYSSLLPPAQPETAYPNMPLVSSLPGTTASPIRIPFGNGKGELIDLPGVHRSTLDTHIQPAHRAETVMKHRIVPEQHILRPGQSLLLGGIIRITPKPTTSAADDTILLAYPFVPLAFAPHVTGTHKAIAVQTGVHDLSSRGREGHEYSGTVTSIATDEAKRVIQSAGTFTLQWNATKRRAGPLTDRAAGKQKADDLPFVIYSADLLIEGVGWVELACQVRKPRQRVSLSPGGSSEGEGEGDALSFLDGKPASSREEKVEMEVDDEASMPKIEVFTPEGKFVGLRRPMNAWVVGGPKTVPSHLKRVRPRRSIGMMKRRQ